MPFAEIADRVWVARYPWLDVNVSVVGGSRGLVVVDTHSSALVAREVVADVRALGAGEVVAVVNTHEHFDHTFGNVTFREEYGAGLPIHATDEAAARTIAAGERIKRAYDAEADDPHRDEVLATTIVPADQVFSSASVLDLGDRAVELVHPGRGHTGGDLVVRVPAADALLAGDLVEESAPPAYGGDSYPLDWPQTLDLVLNLTTPGSVVVPGHGAVVDRAFVQDQRSDIGVVAETIRDLAGRGVPLADALAAAEWPFPAERLADAVRRGYEQLPRSEKRLPLA
ncbi:MBL fold metallo-hydrolase [Nocardioides bizhenqiangii]|uniref:MBL fold metallo-hydrolase n=1 Tax=Nocardioides bizhenqiangii TaxID=3095076 RepID=A0ABZ0ZV55_9ACTN|nr:MULTISPECIES: MBL fold metallo-hydrolase [unclassified Nocardioides]MDZ5623226.1 MBL fold metallo-hydrolase [Nocardioides sp. HM23]WQQ28198.1 MBL fold metallo-hydrolase [Nocardioides sp. HM61]